MENSMTTNLILVAITSIVAGWYLHIYWLKTKAAVKKWRKQRKQRKAGPSRPAFRAAPKKKVKIGDLEFVVQRDDSMAGYKRANFGPALSSKINGERKTPRDAALIRTAQKGTIKIINGAIIEGVWKCPYSGKVLTHPSQIQIDHIVPLAEAWRSGAQIWEYNKAIKFARDPQNLIAVSKEINQEKSDKDISEWLPSYNRIEYLAQWLKIKNKYGLTIDNAEFKVIESAVI